MIHRVVAVHLALCLAPLVCTCVANEQQRPNILFLFSDDHGVKAISAYGGPLAEIAPTPNIDRLAREGAVFLNSFCANSICGPSRATILTGKSKDWRQSIYCAYYELGEHAVPQHFGVRTHAHKLMYFPGTDEWNLFDLVRDPQEMRSVHDDPNYRKVRSDLTAEFTRLRKHYNAPPIAPE